MKWGELRARIAEKEPTNQGWLQSQLAAFHATRIVQAPDL
jgi:hypothetical protein